MDQKLYNIPEAADRSRLSQSWWRKRIFQKEVRFIKVGRRVLIPESTINELIEKGAVEPKNSYSK